MINLSKALRHSDFTTHNNICCLYEWSVQLQLWLLKYVEMKTSAHIARPHKIQMQCESVNDSGSQVLSKEFMRIHFTERSLTDVYVLPNIMLKENSWTNGLTQFLSLDILTGSTNDLKCTCYNGMYQNKWPNRCMVMLQSWISTASSNLEWVAKSEILLPPTSSKCWLLVSMP